MALWSSAVALKEGIQQVSIREEIVQGRREDVGVVREEDAAMQSVWPCQFVRTEAFRSFRSGRQIFH